MAFEIRSHSAAASKLLTSTPEGPCWLYGSGGTSPCDSGSCDESPRTGSGSGPGCDSTISSLLGSSSSSDSSLSLSSLSRLGVAVSSHGARGAGGVAVAVASAADARGATNGRGRRRCSRRRRRRSAASAPRTPSRVQPAASAPAAAAAAAARFPARRRRPLDWTASCEDFERASKKSHRRPSSQPRRRLLARGDVDRAAPLLLAPQLPQREGRRPSRARWVRRCRCRERSTPSPARSRPRRPRRLRLADRAGSDHSAMTTPSSENR